MADFECSTINELSNEIVANYSNKILLIYANNGIGKTRTSYCLRKKFESDEVLCFSAFFEEYFIWNYDNECEEYYLQINDSDSIIHNAIITNGLDVDINKKFIYLTNKKININFEIKYEKIARITFSLTTGDDNKIDNIKISKGEETLFIWSVFYSIVIQRLSDICDGTDDNLKYIIIDDPVASLVEENIVSIAVQIRKELKKKIGEVHQLGRKMGLFILTHNKIFWNILFNEVSIKKDQCKSIIIKNDKYVLREQKDSPFGYHIVLRNKILQNIANKNISKEDFHNFRVILEKMANIYGYAKWDYFLNEHLSKRNEFIRLLDYYSHDSNDELEEKMVNSPYSELFMDYFNKFLEDYKWEVNDE